MNAFQMLCHFLYVKQSWTNERNKNAFECFCFWSKTTIWYSLFTIHKQCELLFLHLKTEWMNDCWIAAAGMIFECFVVFLQWISMLFDAMSNIDSTKYLLEFFPHLFTWCEKSKKFFELLDFYKYFSIDC